MLEDEIDALLLEGNRDTKDLDLHLMSSRGAINALRERLAEKKGMCFVTEESSGFGGKLEVITGRGKSTGRAVIRSAVITWLNQNAYR